MAYKVPTVQDMINTSTKKPSATTTSGSAGKNLIGSIYSSVTNNPMVKANLDIAKRIGGSIYDAANSPDPAPTVDYAALMAQQQAQFDAQLQALKQAQIDSRVNALDSQKTSALSGLDAEQSNLSPMYYNKRNQAGARSDIGALNFAQFMSSRGVQGNAAALPEIYKNVGLQSQIGALDQQETSDNASIEARRSGINSAYESDLAAAKADIDAQTMAAQIEQQRLDQTNALEASKTVTAAKTTADNTAYARMQDTKNEYNQNIGQFAADFLAQYNKVKNDGDPSNDWQLDPLMAAHEQKKQGLEEAKASEAKATESKQKETVDNAIQIFGQLGYLTPEMADILKSYGLPTDIVSLQKLKAQNSGGNGEKPWYLQ